jgi:hypothetical protein
VPTSTPQSSPPRVSIYSVPIVDCTNFSYKLRAEAAPRAVESAWPIGAECGSHIHREGNTDLKPLCFRPGRRTELAGSSSMHCKCPTTHAYDTPDLGRPRLCTKGGREAEGRRYRRLFPYWTDSLIERQHRRRVPVLTHPLPPNLLHNP